MAQGLGVNTAGVEERSDVNLKRMYRVCGTPKPCLCEEAPG